ncbi:SDR family NAD(P)-dependent oxidoreductase [Streptomyces sp. NPDC046275]|uniref:SDR family NAD(P)-dependent oxidoreductase n=1 Tax=Streptomyces sp. NPDC046275 TaxID=3157201 RepID=UPI0033F434D0
MNRVRRGVRPGLVVVVTGASSGIGRATALAFARHGARLVLTARSPRALEHVAADCRAAHRATAAVPVPADVTDAEALERLGRTARARFGRIDVWVNAAGVGVLGRLTDVPLTDVRRLWEVNVLGTLNGARAALPVMRDQGRGVLVDIASVLGGVVQAPYMGAYAASKAALVTLDEVLRRELALAGADGVRVCTVLPAGVDTPFFAHAANRTGREVRALPSVATPERVADAVLRAATRTRPPRRLAVGPGARLLPAAHATARRPTLRVIAWRTEHHYLGPHGSAADTPGRLWTPSGDSAAVRGGRHSGVRSAVRAAALGAAGTAAALAVLRAAHRIPARTPPPPRRVGAAPPATPRAHHPRGDLHGSMAPADHRDPGGRLGRPR